MAPRSSSRADRSTTWWPYVRRLLDRRGWTLADLAREGGLDESVIGRWRNHGAVPSAASVRMVAAVFERDVREAFVKAGWFTEAERDAIWPESARTDLTVVSDDALVDEVRSRMGPRQPVADSPQPRHHHPVAAASANGNSNGANDTGVSTAVTTGPRSTAIAAFGHEEAPPPRGEGEGADDDPSVLHDCVSD